MTFLKSPSHPQVLTLTAVKTKDQRSRKATLVYHMFVFYTHNVYKNKGNLSAWQRPGVILTLTCVGVNEGRGQNHQETRPHGRRGRTHRPYSRIPSGVHRKKDLPFANNSRHIL